MNRLATIIQIAIMTEVWDGNMLNVICQPMEEISFKSVFTWLCKEVVILAGMWMMSISVICHHTEQI